LSLPALGVLGIVGSLPVPCNEIWRQLANDRRFSIAASVKLVLAAPRSPGRHRRQRTPTFLSPTYQDPQDVPTHLSFLDVRDRTDLDPFIIKEGYARSASEAEPQSPRYTISPVVSGNPSPNHVSAQRRKQWFAWISTQP
jgi:hypothetical protein